MPRKPTLEYPGGAYYLIQNDKITYYMKNKKGSWQLIELDSNMCLENK